MDEVQARLNEVYAQQQAQQQAPAMAAPPMPPPGYTPPAPPEVPGYRYDAATNSYVPHAPPAPPPAAPSPPITAHAPGWPPGYVPQPGHPFNPNPPPEVPGPAGAQPSTFVATGGNGGAGGNGESSKAVVEGSTVHLVGGGGGAAPEPPPIVKGSKGKPRRSKHDTDASYAERVRAWEAEQAGDGNAPKSGPIVNGVGAESLGDLFRDLESLRDDFATFGLILNVSVTLM